MEIERKFLIAQLPKALHDYPHHCIEQGYLCTDPVVRIRRQDDAYMLTYKSKGLLAREEYNLPLTQTAYAQLLPKIDGQLIRKKRYVIPLPDSDLRIELDIFDPPLAPLIMAEVEFPSEDTAQSFTPPDWFGREVTFCPEYQNNSLSQVLPKQFTDAKS